jgi:sialate O-acetylesterase
MDGETRSRACECETGDDHDQGQQRAELQNVLVGEVWICSGQSNMQLSIVNSTWDADLDIATAKYPQHPPHLGAAGRHAGAAGRLQRRVGGMQSDECGGSPPWVIIYGRVLHKMLGVPVGLIDNAWGGSACEAWVKRRCAGKRPALCLDHRQVEADRGLPSRNAAFDKQVRDHKARQLGAGR